MRIEFRDLKFYYKKEQKIFDNLNMILDDSRINVIYGVSGSGKSTLYNLITGNLFPKSGEISININNDFTINNLKGTREKIGYVTQNNQMMDELTLLENLLVKLSYDIRRSDSNNSIKKLKAQIAFYSKFLQINDLLNEYPDQISVGEYRRSMVVKSLIYDPDIIIMDEPTANLDFPNRLLIEKLLNKVNSSGTKLILIFSHDTLFLQKREIFSCYKIKDHTIYELEKDLSQF